MSYSMSMNVYLHKKEFFINDIVIVRAMNWEAKIFLKKTFICICIFICMYIRIYICSVAVWWVEGEWVVGRWLVGGWLVRGWLVVGWW